MFIQFSMLIIVDLGISNVASLTSALSTLEVAYKIGSSKEEIYSANSIILPGVGAFKDGMDSLREKELIKPIYKVGMEGVPILGICLGMQLLGEISYEFGEHKGLGLLSGRVSKLPNEKNLPIPNVGWCDVFFEKDSLIYDGISQGESFYFVHSYTLNFKDDKYTNASIKYGSKFISVGCNKDKIYGCQFHPEKSQDQGLRLLQNFVKF